MRARIRGAIVGVTTIIVLLLGIPLAILVQRSALDSEVVELQAVAVTTLTEIAVPPNAEQLARMALEPDAPARFAVYGVDGVKVFGVGPASANRLVAAALEGRTMSSTDGEIVVVTPITARGSEQVSGALRVTESLAGANRRSRTAWSVMAVAGALAIGVAWVIANRLAQLLAAPLTELAADAATLGEGSPTGRRRPTGLSEIDDLARVLAERTRLVEEALARERRFSADVSHQLRTPITALRLKLEAAPHAALRGENLGAVLADLDRLERTVDHLLAVARDAVPTGAGLVLETAVGDVATRWNSVAETRGRTVTAEVGPSQTTVRLQRASIEEILDVLIDNALKHGEGTVSISLRHLPRGVAVDVADEGDGIELLDADRVFERGRGSSDGEGIGLSVARSIAEAEGGRVVLSRHRPTTFSLLLLDDLTGGPIAVQTDPRRAQG